MDIKSLGEFGLIERIRRSLPQKAEGLVKGIGDDCAVFDVPEGWSLLATCDSLVSGVHFLEGCDPFLVGKKAVAVNVSDVAAMGGVPAFLLVSLGLPPETPAFFVDRLYEGLAEEAARFGAAVIGGNLTGSPERVFVDVTLIGRVERGKAIYRGGAKPGDVVAVTGAPGEAAAGLALLLNPEISVDEKIRRRLVRAHESPEPRLAEGRLMAASGLVTACVDVSDGLLADLGHILSESGVGADIFEDRAPVSDPLREAAYVLGKNPLDFTLLGGGDYELCFTVRGESFDAFRKIWRQSLETPVAEIGRITEARRGIRILDENGRERRPPHAGGWDHFAR